jgi:hypothetical protein
MVELICLNNSFACASLGGLETNHLRYLHIFLVASIFGSIQ